MRALWAVSVIASILFLGLFGGLDEAFAETFHAKFDGNWNSPGTWRGDSGADDVPTRVPGPGDTAIILKGVTVTIQTNLVYSDRIDNSGTLKIKAKLTNNGIFIDPGPTNGVMNTGTGIIIISSTGEVQNNGLFNNLFGAKMTIEKGGKFFNNAGGNTHFHNENAEVSLEGDFVNNSDVHQLDKGVFTVSGTGTVTNSGPNAKWDNRVGSTINNFGSIDNDEEAEIKNSGKINNGDNSIKGEIRNLGNIFNDFGGVINNFNTDSLILNNGNIVNLSFGIPFSEFDGINNSGKILNVARGGITNSGSIHSSGLLDFSGFSTLSNNPSSIITNSGKIVVDFNDPIITNFGKIINESGGTIDTDSDFRNSKGATIDNKLGGIITITFDFENFGIVNNKFGGIINIENEFIFNKSGGKINNSGKINIKPDSGIKNESKGIITNKSKGEINNLGTILN